MTARLVSLLLTVCPTAPLQVERLPDLNVPRLGHSVFCVGGEVVAAGGHTTGFVPTQTAEYYRDGQWHLIETAYSHDHGGAAVMPSGQVLLFGGREQALQIASQFASHPSTKKLSKRQAPDCHNREIARSLQP